MTSNPSPAADERWPSSATLSPFRSSSSSKSARSGPLSRRPRRGGHCHRLIPTNSPFRPPQTKDRLFSPAGCGNLAKRQRGSGKFFFSLRGVGPPWTRGRSFHEANGGDEGVENAWVLPGVGSIAQGPVKGVRVPAYQVLRFFNPNRSQIAGDRCADVWDCFEDCGQSRIGRLACGQPRRDVSRSGQAGRAHD
jgi:hypothetical protein